VTDTGAASGRWRSCRTATFIALVVAVLGACSSVTEPSGPIPAPPIAGVTCEEVPSELCHAAHAEAVANGLFLDPASRVVHAVVRPTTVRVDSPDCAPLVDL
jgi:hypothetical protein